MLDKDAELLSLIRRQAGDLGLRGPAVAPAEAPPGATQALAAWLSAGQHGEMGYMERRGTDRANPRAWADWARSVALFADSYDFHAPVPADPAQAAVSRYACGTDYHEVLKKKLGRLCQVLHAAGFQALPFVDSSPLMERALAARGGLGWIGKNANLLTLDHGSFFFLGGLVTDAKWPPADKVADGCGDCIACIDACPTRAIVAPGIVDARRCISYLTIELKGAIPTELRASIGNRVFGCDDCQDVCPWNRLAVSTPDPAYRARPEVARATLLELAELDESEFFERFRGTPVRRARWRGLLRNVMVALGNWGEPEALPGLLKGLANPEPLVRQHAAWGIGRIGISEAGQALAAHLQVETDAGVVDELRAALRQRQLSSNSTRTA